MPQGPLNIEELLQFSTNRIINSKDAFTSGAELLDTLSSATSIRLEKLHKATRAHQEKTKQNSEDIGYQLYPPRLIKDFYSYVADASQRHILFADMLRQRGNNFVAHDEAGAPPVLAFDYETIVDGRELQRPCNYALVRIIPPKDKPDTKAKARPYIIIDPRAGHGSGIGGFKDQSEVGCALNEGHPVYFVIFFPTPEPSQTLSDVCAAEATFVRTVRKRHPDAPHPIIIGNCQGGWGAMLLAATNPDITGPVVANGAPLSYWAGEVGQSAMRYLGGITGGAVPVMLLSDLTNGIFDGANLVLNFESLNPGNTWWTKYYTAYANVDEEAPRYLEFERWWSGFYLMNENEIRWILDNLFIGNKLARGQAMLDESTHVDLRNIRSPIIIFASHGDNITPPPQALNWISDNYTSTDEIKARGQRILYTLHPEIGHLGIFVSSNIANKQHREIVSTLKTIEALAPGLYEMVITDVRGSGEDKQFTVAFEERSIDDVLSLDDGRNDEKVFGAVARMSSINSELYDAWVRPWVKAMVTPTMGKAMIDLHPLRQRRLAMSDKNPLLTALPQAATMVRNNRQRADNDNIFIKLEHMNSGIIEYMMNSYRDLSALASEAFFFSMWGNPIAQSFGGSFAKKISDAPAEDLVVLPEVQRVLDQIDKGGYPGAVIRMMILLAHARGSVRRDRLERSNKIITETKPFSSMTAKHRTRLIHEQSIACSFEPRQALESLTVMLPQSKQREDAMALCFEIAGPAAEMNAATKEMFAKLAKQLDIQDPCKQTPKVQAAE